MIIKYFDEFNGVWYDITGNTGSTLQKGVDSWNTTQGYLILSLLISQTGTDAPTYTELENTLGTTYSFQYNGVGDYSLILDDALMSQGKTMMFLQSNKKDNAIYRNSTTEVVIVTNGNDDLFFTSLEIRIYN
jgi:hypothetical protein